MFVVGTFLTQITFLNMLIAIMGDTFDRVSEIKEQSAFREKILILSDFVASVNVDSLLESKNYMFAIHPATITANECGSWEGTVTSMKQAIDENRAILSTTFTRKIKDVQTQIENSTKLFNMLEDRISDGQRSVEKHFSTIKTMFERIIDEREEVGEELIYEPA